MREMKETKDETISIPLVEVEEVKTGRGGGRRGGGQKYAKYVAAVEPILGFLGKSIAESKDGHIRVKVADLAKAMGMTGKHETSIYWGLKFALFSKGIVVTTGQTKSGEAVLVMREKKEGDTLPASLAKHLGASSVGEDRGEAEEAGEAEE